MAKIYSYRKTSDAYTTYTAQGDEVTELCTLDDGTTYISGPYELPAQPEQISVAVADVTDEIKTAIKAASPHVKLISVRMEERIRAKYSLSEEQYFARIGVGAALGVYVFQPGEQEELLAFGAFVEEVRQWGRDQRAGLGL